MWNTLFVRQYKITIMKYQKQFKLKADKDAGIMSINVGNMTHKVNLQMIQFVGNSNKATIDHKLQGVSLDRMVFRSWNYGIAQWIHIVVILYQVRILEGLFIHKKSN